MLHQSWDVASGPPGLDLSPAPSLAESRRDADWAVCGRSVSLPASANAFPSPGEISTGNPLIGLVPQISGPRSNISSWRSQDHHDHPRILLETHLLPFVKVQVPRKVLAQRFVQLWPWPRRGHGTGEYQKLPKASKNGPYRYPYSLPKVSRQPSVHPTLADSSPVCSKVTNTGAKCLPQTNFVSMVADEVVE
jgi:hypothetical protein